MGSSKGNEGKEPKVTSNEKLFEILNKALYYANFSMDAFTRYQETDDAFDWGNCMEYDKRAWGLLDAYEILTGREVVNIISAIEDEISTLKGSYAVK